MSIEAVAVRDFAECLAFFFPQAERVTLCVLAVEACVLAGSALRPDALAPVPVISAPPADALSLACAASGLAAPGLAAPVSVAGDVLPGSGVVDGVTDVDGLVLSLGEADEVLDGVEAPVVGWAALNRLTGGEHVGLGDPLPPGNAVGEPVPSTEGPPLRGWVPGCVVPLLEAPDAPESVAKIAPVPASPR